MFDESEAETQAERNVVHGEIWDTDLSGLRAFIIFRFAYAGMGGEILVELTHDSRGRKYSQH